MFKFIWQRHLCKRRFSEEWKFHRDLLADELKISGLSPREVRRAVNSRLGRRSRWKREALKAISCDAWPESINWMNLNRLRSSAWFMPASLALGLVLLFVCNPLRNQLLNSVAGEAYQYVPLEKLLMVPADFARFTWGAILLFQIVWLMKARRSWRLS